MEKHKKYVKPAQFAEFEIIKAIVTKKWAVSQKLPPERKLAETLGITRPTLREVLQRLSRDGWITIRHGKPTVVNDYKKNGGLGILNSLIYFNELTSSKLVEDWLEFRLIIFPDLACKAIVSNPDVVIEMLHKAPSLEATNEEFAVYDWDLQWLLINNCNNLIAKMLYNDLASLYLKHCFIFFKNDHAKTASVNYYEELKQSIVNSKENITAIIKNAMYEGAALWSKIQNTNNL